MADREGTLGPVTIPPPGPSAARPRRVVKAPKRSIEADALLGDAREAMGLELNKLKRLAGGPSGLNPDQVRALGLLADAACKLAREERDAAKADEWAGKSKEDVIAEAEQALEELRKS